MKKLFPLLVMLAAIASEKSTGQGSLTMQGAYSLVQQTGNAGAGDTLLKKDQFKIYTDRYMMYASPQTNDSLAIYGIGTYKAGNGKVTEYIFHNSTGGRRRDTIAVSISKTDKGYIQVIDFNLERNRKYRLTEEYVSVGQPVTSPLDGAWRQTRNLYITKNGDTTTSTRTQYKVYQSGYFIWANTYPPDANSKEPISSFGYGRFNMLSPNRSREVNTNSTFITDLVNVPVEIDLEFTGKNTYKQTITHANGDRSVEIYQRLQ